jgi:hypothetical protein
MEKYRVQQDEESKARGLGEEGPWLAVTPSYLTCSPVWQTCLPRPRPRPLVEDGAAAAAYSICRLG